MSSRIEKGFTIVYMQDFNELAQKWNSPERKARAASLAAAIRKTWAEAYPRTILDYGAGTGLIALELSHQAELIVGYDPAAGMREAFQQNVDATQNALVKKKLHPADSLETARTQLKTYQPQAKGFDAVVCSLVLHHIEDVTGTLKEMRTQQTEGGRIVIIDFEAGKYFGHPGDPAHLAHPGFTPTEITAHLDAAGYKQIQVGTAYQGTRNSDTGVEKPYRLFIATATL